MINQDAYGFIKVDTLEELENVKNLSRAYISVLCDCCKRRIVIPVELFGKSCDERRLLKIDSIII